MQAITTRYCGPTNHRGSRIIVKAAAGRMMVGYDDDSNGIDGAHHKAVRMFCERQGWTGEMAQGTLPDGTRVFVFVSRLTFDAIGGPDCDACMAEGVARPATQAAIHHDRQKHYACEKHASALGYPETLIIR
jgi:hypothetical protein